MSYEDGWGAINLEMPSRILRFEADAHLHWQLTPANTPLENALYYNEIYEKLSRR